MRRMQNPQFWRLAVQTFSILSWFVMWWLLLGFGRLQLGFRWYVPVVLFAVMESAGIMIEVYKTNGDSEYIQDERMVIKHIEDNVGKVVTAIAVIAAIPALLLGGKGIPLPTEFFKLVFVAAVALMGGALSWFGAVKEGAPHTMVLFVRQVKAESYRHALTWAIAAVISLYDWLTVILELHSYKGPVS